MLEVRLFGVTTVAGPGGTAPVACGVKPRQILALLAGRLGEPISKDQLAEMLWEHEPPRSYLASLESYVCVLRRELGSGAGRSGALATSSRGYLLDPTLVTVDVVEFRALLHRAERADRQDAYDLAQAALALVRGRLLADELTSSWADEERTVFAGQHLRASLVAATSAQELGRWEDALSHADRALDLERLAEPAWVVRIACLAASGRRAEALKTYAELRDVVGEALGVEPGDEARALYLQLLRGDERGAPWGSERAEIRLLLDLLRQTVDAVRGSPAPGDDRALVAMAARLAGAA